MSPAPDGPTGQLVIDKAFNQTSADPHRDNTTTGRMLLAAVYETLLRLSPDGELEPGLAASYEVSNDATTFTFTLQEDARFSDGTPVTADDVVFSFNRLKHISGPAAFLVAGIEASAADAGTVVLTTAGTRPEVPFILTNPSVAVVNADLVREHGGTDAEDAAQTDGAEEFFNTGGAGASSGPYVMERFSTESEVVLAANPNYWGDAPAFERLVIRNADPAVQRLNILGGQSQLALDLTQDELLGLEAFEIIRGLGASVFYTQATARPEVSEITSSPDFWEAVRYALDYDSLLELAGEGAIQACGVIPRQLLGSLPENECVERDLDRARAALDRLGVENPSVELEYSTTAVLDGIAHGDVGQRVQAHLAEVGIEVTLRGSAHPTALDRWRTAVSQMGQWSISIRFADPSSYLVLSPGGASALRAGWESGADAEIEALAAQALLTPDDDERAELYREWQRLLNERSPFFPIFQAPRIFVTDGSIGGVVSHPTLIIDLTTLTP